MDTFGFGVLGDIFTASSLHQEEGELSQKTEYKFDTTEYTPPDITDIQQPIFQKQQKQTAIETLIPVTINQIIANLLDANQKLRIYNIPVIGVCIVGKIVNLESTNPATGFDLDDSTNVINVHFANNGLDLNNDDYVQVVGSLVVISLDNYYLDAQHIINFGPKSKKVDDLVKYHHILVAYTAYNLDVSYKLKLQNKHIGKLNELPGPLQLSKLDEITLGDEYKHITNQVEILILKYLKYLPDGISKRASVMQLLSQSYQESEINDAVKHLESESEIALTKDHICLPY